MSLAGKLPMVFIPVPDHARAKAWYIETLGLKFVDENEYGAQFDLGGAPMRLVKIPDWKPHAHTIMGFMVDDIHASITALKAKGVKFEIYPGFGQDEHGVWSAPGGSAKIAWFFDPDGNNLSLTEMK